jgi:hypothetical protein
VKGGIVKRQYHRPSYNAHQTYDPENYATIIFKDSPFCGQKGRILKEIQGRHRELHLEMPNGDRIKVDVRWTDYRKAGANETKEGYLHCIDLAQAESVIQFLKYLRNKLSDREL